MGKKSQSEPIEAQEQYRQRIMDTVCAVIATSDKGLGRICKAAKASDPNFPHKCTVLDWIRESEEFANQYARAKEEQADHIFDEILAIADDSSEDEIFVESEEGTSAKRVCNQEFIQRSKLRVDARKWVVSKLLPRKYGEKVETTLTGDPANPLQVISRIERVVIKPNGDSQD